MSLNYSALTKKWRKSSMKKINPENKNNFDVLGIPVSIVTLQSATKKVIDWAADKKGRFVCIRDVHGVVRTYDSPELMDIHKDASMVTPDGMPLVMLGKLSGNPVERACGPDLFEEVMNHGRENNVSHYFYGGNEGVAEELANRLTKRFPGLKVAGYECPPFRPLTEEEDADLIERISKSGADVVWVGLSTPKQEFWMHEHFKKLPATLIGVGAAFDFHTGRVKRAPKWMQKYMLEWLYRLCSEPTRLWKRYLIMAPRFVYLVVVKKLFGR